MAFVKKLWKNRVSDYPTRRLITPVGQGDAFVAEIERNEGTITEEGDPFNAATMNDLEQRIEDGIGAGSAAIAPEETSSTASRAYSVNQFLIYNDKLYKVIATIPQGATLVPDTNIQEDTVGAELTAGITTDNAQNSSINGLNGQLTYEGTKFYFDYKNGKWGWNSSAGRGADTFHPFKSPYAPQHISSVDVLNKTSASASVSAENYYVLEFLFGGYWNPAPTANNSITLSGVNILDTLVQHWEANSGAWTSLVTYIVYATSSSIGFRFSTAPSTDLSGNRPSVKVIKCSDD